MFDMILYILLTNLIRSSKNIFIVTANINPDKWKNTINVKSKRVIKVIIGIGH